jgi:hypothetical protein
MIISCAYGVGAAFFLLVNGRAIAAALLVLAAWRGGMAALLVERPGAPSWQRAAAIVLNVCGEGAAITAAAVWVRREGAEPAALAVGFLAFAGVLLLSYARVRIRASAGLDLADGPYGVAAREVRLLLLAVGVLAGQPYWPLVAIAALTHGSVAGHLVHLRRSLAG